MWYKSLVSAIAHQRLAAKFPVATKFGSGKLVAYWTKGLVASAVRETERSPHSGTTAREDTLPSLKTLGNIRESRKRFDEGNRKRWEMEIDVYQQV